MGRTILAYSMQLEILEKRLGAFRRGLRKEDQDILDDILRWGKSQVQSGALASCPNPSDPVFFSALIELKRELNQQARLLEELKEPPPPRSAHPEESPPRQQLKEELKKEITEELRQELRLELEEELNARLPKEIRKAIQEAVSENYNFF